MKSVLNLVADYHDFGKGQPLRFRLPGVTNFFGSPEEKDIVVKDNSVYIYLDGAWRAFDVKETSYLFAGDQLNEILLPESFLQGSTKLFVNGVLSYNTVHYTEGLQSGKYQKIVPIDPLPTAANSCLVWYRPDFSS